MQTEPRPPLPWRLLSQHGPLLERLLGLGYALVLAVIVLPDPHGAVATVTAVIAIIVLGLAVALHRPHPLLALVLALSVVIVLRWPYPSLFPLWCALYQMAARDRRTAVAALGAALAVSPIGVPFHDRALLIALISGLVWTIGYAVGRQRAYRRQLRLHQRTQVAAELERARHDITEQRIRIARELHDVLAHSLSVITVQAGYGHLVIDEHPAKARVALGVIETTGRQALTEMRHLLDVLRDDGLDDPGALAPAPGLGDLDQLITQIAQAGVLVNLQITGHPQALPPGIDLSAYRIVQEALTNVVKHAGTPRSEVSIAYEDDHLSIQITDDGHGCPSTAPAGHGLIGMQERVTLYRGCWQAGPLPEGGFAVSARLPLTEAPS
jgi:signal transduction histidine kinase